MRIVLAFALLAFGGSASLSAECTLYNARYKQADAPWGLTFTQVPNSQRPIRRQLSISSSLTLALR